MFVLLFIKIVDIQKFKLVIILKTQYFIRCKGRATGGKYSCTF